MATRRVRRFRPLVAMLAAGLALAAETAAFDRPVDGRRLTLKSINGREKLFFLTRDEHTLFPVPGSADDPGSGTPGGLVVELFSASLSGGATLTVPAGFGDPGWSLREGQRSVFLFRNKLAPAGISVVQKASMRSVSYLKVVAKAPGLPMTAPLGTVGIRVTIGSLRNCALFDAASVRRDEPGVFIARDAPGTFLPDCSDAALGGGSGTTTTTTTSTTTTTATTPGFCGDGVCFFFFGEFCGNCPVDCGPCGTCVIDGTCDRAAGESCIECSADCGSCSCGPDGSCDTAGGENCATCGIDCNPCFACGDGFCAGGETCGSCPGDCCP